MVKIYVRHRFQSVTLYRSPKYSSGKIFFAPKNVNSFSCIQYIPLTEMVVTMPPEEVSCDIAIHNDDPTKLL